MGALVTFIVAIPLRLITEIFSGVAMPAARNVILDHYHYDKFKDTNVRRAKATPGNVVITWNDAGVMTRKDIEWSNGYLDSCDKTTGVGSMLWSGMKEAGSLVNITGLCGEKLTRRVEGKPALWDTDTIVVPHGRFEGVVPAGKGSQAKISGQYKFLLPNKKRDVMELQPGQQLIIVASDE